MNRPTRFSVLLLAIELLVGSSRAQDQPSFLERLNALEDEYSSQGTKFRKTIAGVTDPADRDRLLRQESQRKAEFPRQVLALARSDPHSKNAPGALRAIIVTGGHSPEAVAAVDQLRRDWLLEPEVAIACLQLGSSDVPDAVPLLRDILDKNPDRTARGLACFSLARQIDGFSRIREVVGDERTARRLESSYGRDFLEDARRRQPELASEARQLYERVVAEFADVKQVVEFPTKVDRVIGTIAQKWLDQHDELAVGKPAPEIEAKGLDGQTFKLSDYRGKVVVLDFWGSWCPPCVAMIPHERGLVKRLEGKPFAFLGINTDRTEDVARAFMAKEQITWPNWFDGRNTPAGISERYRIMAFPTVYVLDGKGIIRAKDVRGSKLEEAVEKILEEMNR